MGYADNVAALGHEAYRDGLTPDENYLETRESVRAHTELAARMRAEGANFSGSFVGQDLAVYDYARSVGDMSIMAKYADDFYDSSGDYLTLVRDGYNFFLEYDGLADIYDEDGQFLVGAGTGRYDIQTALSKYLNVSMSDAAKILEEAGFETNGDSWITDKNNGKRLAINSPTDADADSYIYAANYIQNIKGAIAAVLFEKGGDVAAARNALLLETLNSGDDRYIDLRNLAIDIFLPNYRMFGDVVNSLSTDANDPNYPSGSIHKGNDYAVARGTVFNTIFSGIVKEISTPNSIVFDTLEAFNASRNLQTPESDHKWYYTHHDERKDAAGNTLYLKDQNVRGNGVIIEHGFIFEGNFISMGFFTRSNHFDSVSVTLGQYVTGGTGIGLAGNSGWSTGSHVDHNTYFKANTKNFIQDLYELDTSVENWDGDRYVNPKNLYDLFK
jgi:murein DD-endopeptidase MepM/ murein hydrolase activator NlpD